MAARRRVVWAPSARGALEEAIAFVAADSELGARRLLEQALAAADSLSMLGERGRVVPEFDREDLREIFVFRYRLLYEVRPGQIRILAFLHGARDFRPGQRPL